MVIGELDTRIAFLEPQYSGGRVGQEVTTYLSRIPAWAKVESIDIRDQARFRQAGLKGSSRLTVRQTAGVRGVADDWRITLDGKQYAIESISHVGREWTIVSVYRIEP